MPQPVTGGDAVPARLSAGVGHQRHGTRYSSKDRLLLRATMADRKHISTETKLRLFSEAAGHCQCPECLRPLFPAEMGGDKHIAEMAHVIPHGDTGPRHSERPVGVFQADSFENLILLCPTCHTIVDKDPNGYSRGTRQPHFQCNRGRAEPWMRGCEMGRVTRNTTSPLMTACEVASYL